MTSYKQARKWLADADAVIVTAGNGFARSEGLDLFSEEEFDNHFGRWAEKYDVHTIADALTKHFASWSETWTFWSQLINTYTLNYVPSPSMLALKTLLKNKKYFIATSVFAHFFERTGFNAKRIFNTQGDWTKMQCSSGINHGLKDDRETVRQFVAAARNDQVTEEMVPKCDICNSEMELQLPLSSHFFPDADANARFRWFLTGHEEKKVVFLELGVDETSPQLLEPIIKLVEQYPNWRYLAADWTATDLPSSIAKRSLAFNSNLTEVIKKLQQGD